MKKARGRPKKNKLDLNSDKINNNHDNIIPASRIKVNYQKKNEYTVPVLIHCDTPKIWKTLFEVIKDNHPYVVMIFDESGIVICTHPNIKDIKHCSIKLFPNSFVDFYVEKTCAIEIDAVEFYKIIKSLSDKVDFVMYADPISKSGYNILTIISNDGNMNKETHIIEQADITKDLDQYIQAMKSGVSQKYDVVLMIEANEFYSKCKNMKAISDEFEISFIRTNGINELRFTFLTNNKIRYECLFKDPNSLIVLETLKEDFSVKRKIKIDKIFKFTKCRKFSTILKIYLPVRNEISQLPTGFEYDIGYKIGTLQVFIDKLKDNNS